jgi:phospho-N-acetylmuramoyl-pentapeptide-transferase
MLLVLLLGPLTIKILHKLKVYSPGRLNGLLPEKELTRKKDQTPMMGGVLIIFAITLSSLLWGRFFNPLLPLFLITLLAFGGLGFADDYMKIKRGREGMSGKLKLLVQFIIASAAVGALFMIPVSRPYMYQFMIPFFKYPIIVGVAGAVFSIIIGILSMMGAANAVNLTDGEDGLAVGCIIFSGLVYAIFAYICGHKFFAEYFAVPFIAGSGEVAIFAASIAGASIGFLWYNCHPASMFMGDTGSLALGGSIAFIAVLVKQEILLILAGGVFVIEAGSVIIQVASFKLRGKRVFLMTPIHHHFEKKKWKEEKIVVRFWILAGICALAALATLKIR